MSFWIPMGIMITVVIVGGLLIGEEKVNKWFRCKHKWTCLDDNDEVDNDNPVRIVCSRCGRENKIEDKE